MEGTIQYVEDFDELKKIVYEMLDEGNDKPVMISGAFDNEVYKLFVDRVITSGNTRNAKIIIPMVGKNGVVSRNYINKICSSGGRIKINSKYKNNIIIIGEYAFIISFSAKYSSEAGIKMTFECCVVTNERNTVEKIIRRFDEIWNHSLPLVQN